MKQITLLSFKKLLLLLIATCIGTYGYSQEERIYFHDLSSSSNNYTIKVQDVIQNSFVNEWTWGFLDVPFMMSSTSTNKYSLRFQGQIGTIGSKYFTVKQNVNAGKYKIKMRIRDRYDQGNKYRFFYTTSDPASSEKVYLSQSITPTAPTTGTLANLYESDILEINSSEGGKDYYFGITLVEQAEPGFNATTLFGDFEIVKITDGTTKTYPVRISDDITNGKVSLKVDGEEVSGEIEEGKTVTVEVTPDKYYELASLTYKVGTEGEEQDIKESKSFNVTGEIVVNATFSKAEYTITYEQPENGSIKVMNEQVEVKSGDKVEAGTKLTVEATPNEKCELVELKAGENDILQDKSFIVEDNTVITARFALPKCTLTYTIKGGEWVADITIKDKQGNTINSGDKVEYDSKYIVRAEKKKEGNAVNIKVNGEQVIANVNGKVYTYEGTVKGDTNITIDLFSDINSTNKENVYYDSTTQILHTGNAKNIKVYDMNGRVVINVSNTENINLATLEEGIYIVVSDNIAIKFCK